MKKDGVLESMKSSRLRICDDDSPTEPAIKKQSDETTVTQIPPRTVAEARTCKPSDITAGNVGGFIKPKPSTRGMPKSGRVWKPIKSARFSTIKHDKPDRTTWQHKVNKKADGAAVKSLSQQVKEEKLEREKVERERIAEKRKRKLENEKKSEIVVPIKNPAKIKRMRKKRLRTIEKR